MLRIVVVLWFCIHHAALNLLFVGNFDVAFGHDGFRRWHVAVHRTSYTSAVGCPCMCVFVVPFMFNV
jgi:hypothetical protein